MPMLERLSGIVLGLAALLFGFTLGRDRRHDPSPQVTEPADLGGHETTDLSIRAVAIFGFTLLLFLAITFAIVSWMMNVFSGEPLRLAPPSAGLDDQVSGAFPADPRLETVPGQSMAELQAQQQAQLREYRWLDPQNGRVQIPIDRAMEILAERGLPSRQDTAPYQDQGVSSPSGASSGRVLERDVP